jgi:hypothetical protein
MDTSRCFHIAFINVLGRGVFASKTFWRGDFLIEYKGVLTQSDPGDLPYVFEFQIKNNTYWYVSIFTSFLYLRF